MVLVDRSRVATALFSCITIVAVESSPATAMYSGSRSCATVAPGPNILTPLASRVVICELKDVNPTCVAVRLVVSDTSITVTEPTGSTT